MEKLQAQLEKLSGDYQKLQQDLSVAVKSRQKLDSQKQENEGVKEQFDNLKEDEVIYKLVGPVLLKQEKFEAEGTVKGRLDYIGKETERVEEQIKEIQKKIDGKRGEIMQVQAAAQQLAGQQGQQGQQGQGIAA